jgi:hypothetical protein
MRLNSLYIKTLLAGILLFAPLRSFCQNWPFELWHDGKIVLDSGDTLKGLVKYDLQQDIVQFEFPSKKTEALSARKVLYFEIFDTSVNQYRRFFALPFTSSGNYKVPIFFELLEEGKITLLSREALEYRTYSSPYFVGSYTRLVLVNKFFFLEENGDIVEFTGTRSDLLDKMGRRKEDVEKYIKSNHLRIEDKYDFAKIIAHYNSFFNL